MNDRETNEPDLTQLPEATETEAPEATDATTETPATDAAEATPAADETEATAEVATTDVPEAEVTATPGAEATETPEAETAAPTAALPVAGESEATEVETPEAAVTEAEPMTDAPEAEAPETEPTSEAPQAEATAHDAEATAGAVVEPAAAPAPTPTPSPTPRPRPVPRPSAVPRPGVPTPAAVAPVAPSVPAPPDLTPAEAAEAARWGRVDDDGTVWVREESGDRTVGQYPGADASDALAFYVRRYADLHAKVLLFEARLTSTDIPVKEIDSTLEHLTAELAEPAAVGDLAALRTRLEGLRTVAAERRAVADAERAAAKRAALEERTAIVEAAEKIAATPGEKMQWRPAGEQLRVLLDQWKEAQRHGPRLDRGSEDSLWKRFSHARSTFDRERRRYFADLEKVNAVAKAEKMRLVTEAEKLSSSTEWGATTGAYRDLMTQWKAAGRASRKDDDALWARFRTAQDVFFAARDAANKQTDEEYSANLEVKLRLLEDAERLVPVKDLNAAKSALRDIQERWEQAGKVPRADVQRVEARLRAVEQAVRDADQAKWQRTNPETRARAEGALAQLTAAIAGLEADLEAAKAKGDARKVAEAQAALDARKAWLEQVERAAADSQG